MSETRRQKLLELAAQAALEKSPANQSAKIASQMNTKLLAKVILTLSGIKKLNTKLAEAALNSLSTTNNSISKSLVVMSGVKKINQKTAEKSLSTTNKTNTSISKALVVLSGIVKAPEIKQNMVPPSDAIGEVYFAGRKVGYVYGTEDDPKFKLKGSDELVSTFDGWKLLKNPNQGNRYDLVKEKVPSTKKPLENLVKEHLNENLASHIVAILKGINVEKRGFFGRLFSGVPKFEIVNGFVFNPLTGMRQFINGIPVQWNRVYGFFIEIDGKRKRVFQRGPKLVSENNNTATNNNSERNMISNYLYSQEFSKMSATARSRKLAELLKKYPHGSKERRAIKTRILEEIRNAGQNRNAVIAQRRLANLRANIGSALSSYHNSNLLKALGIEKKRAVQNLETEYEIQERRYGSRNEGRRYGYANEGRIYGSRNEGRRYGSRNEGRIYGSRNEGRRYGYANEGRRYGYANEGRENESRRTHLPNANVGGNRRTRLPNTNVGEQSLPTNQRNAISNAGGVRTALNTVANVPGGATEVAKAAEALKETNGNLNKAVTVKGASPVAIQAVKKLGGAKTAIIVLHGLNTLSQKPATIRRKATTRRKKPLKIRVAELNRVIDAVKKQKLISLVAHNVTKTHNIHPNDEKKKKYYKKVIKANILRTKFAKIVKKAAKKNK